jgi:xylulokinase
LAYLLGIDLGAGSLKATIISAEGVLAGEGSHPVTTTVPHFRRGDRRHRHFRRRA